MAESQTSKTKELTRDTLSRDSSAIREDTEQIVASHKDNHGYTSHGIAKMETEAWCRHEAQEHQQSSSQKAKFMDIKEEVRDMDSEFPEQFQVPRSEKCLSSYEITIADVKEEVSDMEVDFHGQLEFFNSNQSISSQEIIMTDVQGENKENLSTLSGKESTQNIKNGFFEHKMYGIKVKEELMANDAELHNYFDANNIEKSFSPQKSILKNAKSEIIENEVILPGDLKVQNSEKCIDQKSNTINEKVEVAEIYSLEQLGIFNYNQCFSDRKTTITYVKGVTDNETDLGLPRITNIKTCDSAQTFNSTFVKKEEPEYDVEFPKHFETLYREQCGSVDKIIIANVKGGITENETNLPRELRGQTVEKTVSEQKSNAVIIKDEQIEIERELTDDCINLLKQIIPAKDITDEKTPKAHTCNVSCGSFCSKEKLTRNMQITTHPVKVLSMSHGIAKTETEAWCRHEAQEHQQSSSQKAKVMDIKEEVRDMDSEFPEQFQVPISEKCLSSYEITIADVKEEVSDMEVDFHGQLEFFNSNQSISSQEIIMTDVQGENKENLSTLSGKESTQNIKNGFFEHKMYGIKVKEESMANDAELHNYFDANNIEKSLSAQKSILKNVKSEIIENEATLTGDLKVQNSEKCIDQKSNTVSVKEEIEEKYSPEQLVIHNYNQCFSDRKINITDVKGAVTDNETDFLELVKITNIKTCVSAQTFNNSFVKKEEPEEDLEFSKHFETLYREKEKTVSKQKSNTVIVKDEQIEIENELHEDYIHLLKQKPAKGITDEKTPKEHICNVSCRSFCSKEKLTQSMQIKIPPVNQFKCEICEKVFHRRSRFSVHMNVHTKEKEYKCKFCEKVYYRRNTLYDHLNLHTKEKKYKCDICDNIYYQRSSLAKHMESHLNEEQRSCKFCGKLFSMIQSLKRHLNTHTKEKKFKCNVCDKVYFFKAALINHMQSHLNEEQRSCKFCGKLFSMTHNLKRHLNLHAKEKEFT